MIRVFDSAKIIELSKKYKIFHWGLVKIAVYIVGDGGSAAAHGTAGAALRRGRDGTAGGQRWHRCVLNRRYWGENGDNGRNGGDGYNGENGENGEVEGLFH